MNFKYKLYFVTENKSSIYPQYANYNSTIFKTINDEVGQTKVVLNDTVKSLFNGSLFKKESLLS